MSRSRKRVWGWTDHRSPHSKIAKRLANKKVRHTESIPNGAAGLFDVYIVLDVTEIYGTMIQAGNHGFFLELTTADAMSLHSSRGGNPPKLVITGYD